MSLQSRIDNLHRRHQQLEATLHDATAHPYQDEMRIRTLKVEKLHLKEEIAHLEQAANSNLVH